MTLPEGAWEDDGKVPVFHKYYIEKQWQQGTGIFIRSMASFNETWKHFRKFTKVQDEQGKWYFFRFWDHRIIFPYMSFIKNKQKKVAQFFNAQENLCKQIILPISATEAVNVIAQPMGNIIYGQIIFDKNDIELFRELNDRPRAHHVLKKLK